MVGEGEERIKQETHCSVVYADVYRCGVDDDVRGSNSQQDDVSECLVGLNDHFSHLSWILINNNKYKLLMF